MFALCGRSRLGDLRILEALSLSHKYHGASNSKGMRLHLVVPAKGIGPRSWGKDFLTVASELRLDLSRIKSGEPLLYMPNA